MQDPIYSVGQEVWFYEKNGDNKYLFNGYVVSWQLISGTQGYSYSLMVSQNGRITKGEGELYQIRDTAANAMQGIVVKPIDVAPVLDVPIQ